MPRSPRVTRALKWTGILAGVLIVLLVIVLGVLQWNADAFRGPIARVASAHLQRAVRIDGKLRLHLLTLHPRVIIDQLRVGNPDWAKEQGDMMRVGELQLSLALLPLLKGAVVVPYLGIEDTDLNLIRGAENRANWRFTNPNAPQPTPGGPPKLPVVRSLHIGRGHLTITDQVRKLKFTGTVTANQSANGGAQSLSMKGDGDINGESFQLQASGDPLVTAETGKPYTFTTDVRAGATHAQTRIFITKPFDLGSLAIDLSAQGDDLADLYYLTGLALPNSAPYTVSGHAVRQGNLVKVTNLSGTLGNSDIHGTASIDMRDVRPYVKADLSTRQLDMADLAPTLGAKAPSSLSRKQGQQPPQPPKLPPDQQHTQPGQQQPGEQPPGQQPQSVQHAAAPQRTGRVQPGELASAPHPPTPPRRQAVAKPQASAARKAAGATLLPNAPLDLERVRGMDADLRYRAESVKATKKLSIREIDGQLQLAHGVLTFSPVSFVLPEGKVQATARIDASKDIPLVDIDTRLTSVRLSQFRTKGGGPPPLEGTLAGRMTLHGRGRSIHEVASTASGELSVVIPHGEIRQAFAELTGINVARGLGLLLTGNQDKSTLRCGVANFKAEDGILAAQNIVFDTDTVLITGKGEIDLGDEIVDLSLNGEPKKARLMRIKSPILIHGTFRKPHAGLKPGNTVGQAGAAAALGALVTPLAAVLAFIDPGLAKDADCGSLLAEARQHGAPVKTAAAPPRKNTG